MTDPGAIFDRAWGSKNFWELRAMGKAKRKIEDRDKDNEWFKDAIANGYIDELNSNLDYLPSSKLFDGSPRSNAYLQEIFQGGVIEGQLMEYLDENNMVLPGKFKGVVPIDDKYFRIDTERVDGQPGMVTESARQDEAAVLPLDSAAISNLISIELAFKRDNANPGFLSEKNARLAARKAKNAKLGYDPEDSLQHGLDVKKAIDTLGSRNFNALSVDEKRVMFGDLLENFSPKPEGLEDKKDKKDEEKVTIKTRPGKEIEMPAKRVDELPNLTEITETYGYDVEEFTGEKVERKNKKAPWKITKEYENSQEYIAGQAVLAQKEIIELNETITSLDKKLERKTYRDRGRDVTSKSKKTKERDVAIQKLKDLEMKIKPISNAGSMPKSSLKDGEVVDPGDILSTFREEDFDDFVNYMQTDASDDFRNSPVFKESMAGIRNSAVQELLAENDIKNLEEFITTRRLNSTDLYEVASVIARQSAFDIAYATGQFDANFIANQANYKMNEIYDLAIFGMPIAHAQILSEREASRRADITYTRTIETRAWQDKIRAGGVLNGLAVAWNKSLTKTSQKTGEMPKTDIIRIESPEGAEAKGLLTQALIDSRISATRLLNGEVQAPSAIQAEQEQIEQTGNMIIDALVNEAFHQWEDGQGIFFNLGQMLFGRQDKYINSLQLTGMLNKVSLDKKDGEIIGLKFDLGDGKPIPLSSQDINNLLGDDALIVLEAFFKISGGGLGGG